jgi:hypothetical protein
LHLGLLLLLHRVEELLTLHLSLLLLGRLEISSEHLLLETSLIELLLWGCLHRHWLELLLLELLLLRLELLLSGLWLRLLRH